MNPRGAGPGRDRVQVHCSICHRAIYVDPSRADGQVVCQVCQADSALDVKDATHRNGTIGKTCPYCMSPVKGGEQIIICSECATPHHLECWMENDSHCSVYGCRGSTLSEYNRYREPASLGELPLSDLPGARRYRPRKSQVTIDHKWAEESRTHPVVYWFWGIVLVGLAVFAVNYYISLHTGDHLLKRADRLIRYHDYEKAITILEDARKDPGKMTDANKLMLIEMLADAYETLGEDYFKKGEFDWAQKSYEKSLEFRDPEADRVGYYRLRYLVGNCLYWKAESGRGYITGREPEIDEAREIYEETIAVTEFDESQEIRVYAARGYFNLGLIDFGLGQYYWDRTQWRNPTEALRYFRRASSNFTKAFSIDAKEEYAQQRQRADGMLDEIRMLTR